MIEEFKSCLQRLAIAAGFCLAFTAAALAQNFIPGAEDLPLMDGLTVQDDDAVVFDDPKGRIVEAYATGSMEKTTVLTFYNDTLPELGWQRMSAGLFAREDETLTLDFSEQDEVLVVRFTLAPQ